jgi:hypothetical protein
MTSTALVVLGKERFFGLWNDCSLTRLSERTRRNAEAKGESKEDDNGTEEKKSFIDW